MSRASYFAHLSLYPPPVDDVAYKKLVADLASVGLYDSLVGSKGPAQLPRGTFAGEFEGEGAPKIKEDLAEKVGALVKTNGMDGMLFLSIGGGAPEGWSWRRTIYP